MKPVLHVVKVICICAHAITIRGPSHTIKFCWNCGRTLWFVVRGVGRAVGIVKDKDGTEHETSASVIWSSK